MWWFGAYCWLRVFRGRGTRVLLMSGPGLGPVFPSVIVVVVVVVVTGGCGCGCGGCGGCGCNVVALDSVVGACCGSLLPPPLTSALLTSLLELG